MELREGVLLAAHGDGIDVAGCSSVDLMHPETDLSRQMESHTKPWRDTRQAARVDCLQPGGAVCGPERRRGSRR